jgi:hypothetical protein
MRLYTRKISTCAECPDRIVLDKRTHHCFRKLKNMQPVAEIPRWCPLDKVEPDESIFEDGDEHED